MKQFNFITTFIVTMVIFTACHRQTGVNTDPHAVNAEAEVYFHQAQELFQFFDKDSTRKSIGLIDKALTIDSLNPEYYGVKAKLLSELGLLDSALLIQTTADKIHAIDGEYLFQLGLFQAAKGDTVSAHASFGRSNAYLQSVLKKYPDSLGAFVVQQAANALYFKNDSLFMQDIKSIRKRFSNRLMEIEMTRRVSPHSLIMQLRKMEEESLLTLDVIKNDTN